MSKFSRTITMILAVCGLFLVWGCRTKTKPVPQPAPVMTEPAPVQPETKVEERPDFVSPEVTQEELPSDLAQLTELAHERGWLQDAFYGFDEATLDAQAQSALSASATWLKEHPEYRLLIEGHADERGTEQYNLALGDRRAFTAKNYLVTLGVDADRLRTVSYGEERPFDMGHDEASWAKNRRAHLVIIGR